MPLQPGAVPPRHDAGPASLVRPELGAGGDDVEGDSAASLVRSELEPMGAIGSVFAMVGTFALTRPSFDDVDPGQEVTELQVPVHLAQGPTGTRATTRRPGTGSPARVTANMV